MKSVIEKRVSQLTGGNVRALLQDRKVGLEKESLRVGRNGRIASTAHPDKLGAALTHPYITTDYSEALLEFVTPPFSNIDDTLKFLDDTHRFVYSQLDNEILWSTSMPCVVEGDPSIPIAQYGSSNAAKMKTAYRRGLGHRYGRMMQTISGVHYNYSFSPGFWEVFRELTGDSRHGQEFISESYMGVVRNLQRYGWLIPYLFGASPAICGSFLQAVPNTLDNLFGNTYYRPHATSLRVGDIGYQNNKEGKAGINVNYDSLQSYVDSLSYAISTPYPEYEKIGISVDGEWQQLNSNILQIENEYYSSVRPKQILNGEEKPTLALSRRGIAYIELRSLDVNIFEPLGISREHMLFLESFMLFNLLTPSEPYSDGELDEIKYNINASADRGRDPALMLKRGGKEIRLRDWAGEIMEQMSIGCELLDEGDSDHVYCSVLQRQRAKIEDVELTPSARILREIIDNKEEFFEFSLRLSTQHQESYASRPLPEESQLKFEALARESIQRQRELEGREDVTFEEFMQNYFNQS